MKLYIDSINIEEIKAISRVYPLGGVTCNPSIVKKSNPDDFFNHLNQIQELFNHKIEMHVQVFSDEATAMVKDAKLITKKLGNKVFIKIPANPEGYKAMQALKKLGYSVTATAIYTYIQAICSLEAGADVLAPYVNRIEKLNKDPFKLIEDIVEVINKDYPHARVVGASFKSVVQVEKAIKSHVHHVTLSKDVFDFLGYNEHVETAVDNFLSDWQTYISKHPLK